jgi:hypothetical protein
MLKLVSSLSLNDQILLQNSTLPIIFFSQFLTTLVIIVQFSVYWCLKTILISVACAQFEKVKAAILDIRQLHITPHHVREEEQVHKIAKCNLQEKLNACIRHHQQIIA